MNQEQWIKHIERRSDITSRVTHLTKRRGNRSALENLYKILDERILKASSSEGYVMKDSAVCFQEVPLASLAENIKYETEMRGESGKIRYEGFGIRFNKGILFGKGARPVLYGPKEDMKSRVAECEHWRVVTLDLETADSIIDWTHEREWRIKGDLEFDYSEIEVVVETDKDYQAFVEHYQAINPELLKNIHGIVVLNSMSK